MFRVKQNFFVTFSRETLKIFYFGYFFKFRIIARWLISIVIKIYFIIVAKIGMLDVIRTRPTYTALAFYFVFVHFNANKVILPTIINGKKARNIATNSTHKATQPTALPTLRQIFFLALLPLIFISQCRCYHLQCCSR